MVVPIAPEDLGKRVDSLLAQIAHARDMKFIHLPELLDVEPNSDHKQWLEKAKKARRSFKNLKNSPESIVGTKISSIIISEFKTKPKWRKLMNRLAINQISGQIENLRHLKGREDDVQAIRLTAILQAQVVGSPDATILVDYMMAELGIVASTNSDTKSQRINTSANSQRFDEEKARLEKERRRLEEEIELEQIRIKNREMLKAKAEKERLLREESTRQQLIEHEKQKEFELKQNAAIHPGRWYFRPYQLNQTFAGMAAVNMDIHLQPNGQFSAQYAMNIMGTQADMLITGNWVYDYRQKILSMNGVLKVNNITGGALGFGGGVMGNFMPPMDQLIPPQPYSERFTITGGSDGRYQAYDNQRSQWQVESR